jgi:TraM recognition site of TraD and TraG
MTIRVPFWQRALIVLVPLTALCLWLWSYLQSHDAGRSLRQFLAGKPVTWPPPQRRGRHGGGEDLAGELVGRLVGPARSVAIALLAGGLLLAVLRLVQRRRRASQLATFELRPSRDDVANPYRVQETFEAIVGAASARWYERLWRGQDHFALETHRGREGLVYFTLAAPQRLIPAIAGPLEDLYPDVRLIEEPGRPRWAAAVVRLKKRRSHVLSLQTTRNYDHSFSESLAALLGGLPANTTVQLVLCPAPALIHRRARRLLKQRERALNRADRRDPLDPGIDSVVEAKELKGGLETQHHSLLYFDLRVAGEDPDAVRRTAGSFSQLRSENELVRRSMRLRRRLYARRLEHALPNPLPGLRSGILSTSELATVWQLPRARAKLARIRRSPLRRAVAPPEICRDPARRLLVDEQGPVGIHPEDRRYGQALMGGQGSGKTSEMAPGVAIDGRDDERAIVVADAKEELAKLVLGLIPRHRTVHYIDLGRPEIGFNPLTIDASPGTRASVFLGALIEANPPGAIQARSDDLLRQAVTVVCAVERRPTVWDVYRMLSPGDASYRDRALTRLDQIPGMDFARYYWRREFPELLRDRSRTLEVLDPPLNKLRRLLSTPQVDVVLRHPYSLDIEGAIARAEVIVINGAKAVAGEDNTRLLFQLLLRLVHRAIQAQQTLPEQDRRRVSLYVDEAHNVLTPSVATMLAEGRSAGLEACFAWQYSAQIRDELVRSGVRSLLQSISIFRMRELEDARALAGLAMDVYSDRISVDQQEQERLRFSADDIIHLPVHTAINIWVARGTPRPAFVASTQPMQNLYDPALAEHHLAAQRERGGRYLAHLPAPLGDRRSPDAPPPSGAPHVSGPNGTDPDSGKPARPADGANPTGGQLPFEDL